MPPLELTAEQEEEALKKGGSDLRFLLERNEVDRATTAKWFHIGVTSMEKVRQYGEGCGGSEHAAQRPLRP